MPWKSNTCSTGSSPTWSTRRPPHRCGLSPGSRDGAVNSLSLAVPVCADVVTHRRTSPSRYIVTRIPCPRTRHRPCWAEFASRVAALGAVNRHVRRAMRLGRPVRTRVSPRLRLVLTSAPVDGDARDRHRLPITGTMSLADCAERDKCCGNQNGEKDGDDQPRMVARPTPSSLWVHRPRSRPLGLTKSVAAASEPFPRLHGLPEKVASIAHETI